MAADGPIATDEGPGVAGRPAGTGEDDVRRCYRALASRDPRFDGHFFFGVVTTGIYCRPICPAPTPRAENVRIFRCAAAAAEAGFRPCLRCRPEAAPGTPARAGSRASVSRALRLIDEGALDGGSVPALAERLGLGERQLRRLFECHLGVSPGSVARTRRIHFARRLLDETGWPIGRIALAAGFSSLRRFNAAMRDAYGCPPSALRGRGRARGGAEDRDAPAVVRLVHRPPFDWEELLATLAPRAIPGVEQVEDGLYRRAVRSDDGAAWIEVAHDAGADALLLRVPASGARSIASWVAATRRLFDLSADPAAVRAALGSDPLVGPRLARRPGLRLPGAWDGFELAVRIVLGQQVTVAGATTLSGRIAERFGEPLPAPRGAVARLFPAPEVLADARLDDVGLPAARAQAIRALARAVASGALRLEPTGAPGPVVESLRALPGIGPWTAEMIAMRVLGDPDAFPAGDLGLRVAAGPPGSPLSARELARRAEAWRPWRAYAARALWAG